MNILLVDDHEIVRQGLHRLISGSRPDWEICGEAAGGRDGIKAIVDLKPDLVVLDLNMPDVNGLNVTRFVRDHGLDTRILIFSMHSSANMIEEARRAGADGYVLKTEAGSHLIMAIGALLSGGTFFPSVEPGANPPLSTPASDPRD